MLYSNSDTLLSDAILAELTSRADAADRKPTWPADSWAICQSAGVMEWSIPAAYGGRELDVHSLLGGYERLASACLTTAFIVSQRDAAVRHIRDSGRDDLCRELLRPLACGGRFATVGLSQLTTSRQHLGPALRASETGLGFVLDGVIPWVTGADEAQHLVIGAVVVDGQQVLLALPADTPGVSVSAPMELMALTGSRTAEIHCDHVTVTRHLVIAGPTHRVMASGRGGTGGLETSCLALGLAGAAVDFLRAEASNRPELRPLADRLEAVRTHVRDEMHRLAADGPPDATSTLRAKANALALRSTQAALTASKGVGFVYPHPAQRWARQALFFLVWSCPRPAAEATLEYLVPDCE